MITCKLLKNVYPVCISVIRNIRSPYHLRINNSIRCLSTTTRDDTDKNLNACSDETKVSAADKKTCFIDDQYFSEIFENEDSTGDTNVSEGSNVRSQISGSVRNDSPRESDQPQLTNVHKVGGNTHVDVTELNEIDRQYFASIHGASDVKENTSVGHWIYDSIQEIESDTELLNCRNNVIEPKMIKPNDQKDEENDNVNKQFTPHEMPTPLRGSDEYSVLNEESLAELRAKLEHVRQVNKLENKRDVIRGNKRIEKIEHARNLPANVQLEELEPVVAEAVKAITKKKTKVNKKKINYLKLYGTPDPESPLTTIPCCGCGALLHCQDATAGGYLPSEKFKKLRESELVKTPCQRCTLIMTYNHAINVSVSEDDFREMFCEIRKKYALILVMVDLLDFPISFIPNMKSMIGRNKKVMIVGNKVDLLPADSNDCHNRILKQLRNACIESNVCSPEQIIDVQLISSKLGHGVEKLISNIQSNWATSGDVYLIGTANSGKSTLFNRLLNSDFCKTKAKWVYRKATVSRWPGTTLSLLKFPILKPNIERINRREARLREQNESNQWRERMKKNDREFDAVGYYKGHVGRSFEGDLYEDHRQTFNLVSGNKRQSSTLPFKFDPSEFSEGRWLYDTPGIIREEQVLSKLTSEELKLCVASHAFRPKTMVIKPGQTIFLAGLGRLDYLDGIQTIFCTMFAAPTLPVRVVDTQDADEFYKENNGYKYLQVPEGGEERLKTIAPLTACDDVTIEGIHQKESAADILFASAGWLAITPNRGLKAVVRPYTIGGVGCVVRTPALLPYMVNLRGTRLIRSKPFYRVNVDKLVQYH